MKLEGCLNLLNLKYYEDMIRDVIRNCFYILLSIIRIPSNFLFHNNVDWSTRIATGCNLKYSSIGKYNYIATRNSLFNVEVGNYCCFGPDVHIGGMQHSYWWYSMSPLLSDACKTPLKTIIGNDVWIGAQAIIKQGTKIGDGAVIGANAFVNRDVEPFSIVVGTPARHLKYRFSKEVQLAIIQSRYWEKNPEEARKELNNLNILKT